MNRIQRLVVLTMTAVLVSACTASVRVMPGADGTNLVVARDIEKYRAEKAAWKAAVAYCKDHGKEAVALSDSVRYEGAMDEDRRTAIRRTSEAATVLGGVVGAGSEHDAALVLGGAGVVGSTMTSGKDYTAEVQFKCRVA